MNRKGSEVLDWFRRKNQERILEINALPAQWESFYQTYFGLHADFSSIVIPFPPFWYGWGLQLIFIPQGLTMNRVADAYRKALYQKASFVDYACGRGGGSKHWDLKLDPYDLDKEVTINGRFSNAPYALWALDSQKSDKEFWGCIVDRIDPSQRIGITLLEYLTFALFYLVKEGKVLEDAYSNTLCSGSRYTDGRVPSVITYGGEVSVSKFRTEANYPFNCHCGIRRVFAL